MIKYFNPGSQYELNIYETEKFQLLQTVKDIAEGDRENLQKLPTLFDGVQHTAFCHLLYNGLQILETYPEWIEYKQSRKGSGGRKKNTPSDGKGGREKGRYQAFVRRLGFNHHKYIAEETQPQDDFDSLASRRSTTSARDRSGTQTGSFT
tara:strand:- start:86 stop:535 length:450 start_codon:yes stop_codon:yes gene_type:complete